MLHVPGLYITQSEGRGRGVFTMHPLHKGDLIELCPLIIMPDKDHENIRKTYLYHYYFVSPKPEQKMCIVLGYGAIYNHSSQPNAEITFDLDNQNLEIHCMKEIKSGSEIFIDYTGGGMKDAFDLWFEVV